MKPGETGASSGEEPSAEAPAAGLAAEFAPTPWQGRWGGAGKRPGRNLLRFPRPGAGVALRGLLRAVCPRPKCLGGDTDHIARVTVCHPRGKSSQTREAAAPRPAGLHHRQSARGLPQAPNSERAPVFVNKPVTWPRQPAPRPWRPENPWGDPEGPPQHRSNRVGLRGVREPDRLQGEQLEPARTAPYAHAQPASNPFTWRQAARSRQRQARLLRSAWRRRTARLTLALPVRS